ncbi:Hsp20/alpha crystallin family protein [Kitasatospora sp. NPDC059577]|uniref:Hsp20/alpha crystallin family protein n=1 Tax=unclassified Kitasatospora TaxID=2633591 RepID=UPI0036A6B625
MAGEPHRRLPFGNRWPSLPDLFEAFPTEFRTPRGEHVIHIEESGADGVYQLGAELPGVDPDKDIAISIDDGVLTVQAERTEEKKDKQHSEFRYGSFSRSIRLPAGVRDEGHHRLVRPGRPDRPGADR